LSRTQRRQYVICITVQWARVRPSLLPAPVRREDFEDIVRQEMLAWARLMTREPGIALNDSLIENLWSAPRGREGQAKRMHTQST